MPRYTKRKDGRYLVQIPIGYLDNGKTKYKNLYARTQTELDRKVAEFKVNQNKGILVDDKNITLGDWADAWLKTYKNNVSYNTYEMYCSAINNHIKGSEIENIRLSKLKPHHIQNLINVKSDAGLTRTVQILRMTLKQMLAQAVRNELIFKNVADGTEMPTFGKNSNVH